MACEGLQQFAVAHIPQLDGIVTTPADQSVAVRTEGNGTHQIPMAGEGLV
jgi:hypothetical protein